MIRRPPRSTLFPSRRSSDLVYTSGIVTDLNNRETLEELQTNKLNLICEKLRLTSQDKFLDIGCGWGDRKSTRLNSSHSSISYAVFCLKKKKKTYKMQKLLRT